jgi:hypothetical protein
MDRGDMRAGDGDRQTVADKLKSALDDGRLDLHEYDERLQKTYAAKTFGELDPLTADLPGVIPASKARLAPTPPASAAAGQPAESPERHDPRNWLGGYGGVIAVCVLIWGISSLSSGHLNYFWPIWMFIPVFFYVMRQLGGGRDGGGDRKDRRRRR